MSEKTVITLTYCTLFSTLIPIIWGIAKWNKLSIPAVVGVFFHQQHRRQQLANYGY